MSSNRQIAVITALFAAGLACLTQAQVPMTGGGLAKPVASGGGTVSWDACGTNTVIVGTTTSNTTLTVGAGSNRGLVVALSFNTPVTVSSVTWDGVGLTQLKTITSGASDQTELWGLANPASGAKTLTASWNNVAAQNMVGCSWTGVNQTTPFPNTASALASSVSLTSTTGNAVMGSLLFSGGGVTFSGTTVATEATFVGWAATRDVGSTPNVTVSETGSAGNSAVIAVDIGAQ